MPPAIDQQVRKDVVRQWLSGDTRAKIASDNGVGEGTVSNIVSDFKKGMEDSEFEAVRELAVKSRKEGVTLTDLATRSRIYNFINKLGANEEQVESFITDCTIDAGLPPEKIVELTNQLFNISKSESIPLEDVPSYVKQKLEEKQRLDKEIEDAHARLQNKNASIEAVNEYIHLKEELGKYGLSTEDPTKLLNVLASVKGLGFDAKKIVAKLSSIRPLEKRERQLRNNCTMFAKQADRYKAILPLAEKIVSMRIGIDELIAFRDSVYKAANMYNLPVSTAAYRVIQEIEAYRNIGGVKKELSKLAVQINTMNEILQRKNNAIISLIKLQSHGVREDQILDVCRFFEEYGGGIASGSKQVQNAPYLFNIS